MQERVFDLLHTRILSHYDAAKKILKGAMPEPRTAIFYPTYMCNQNCPGCEYQDDNHGIATMMTRRQLYDSLDQLIDLGIKGLEFCGGGEPTLHPDIGQAILKLKSADVSVGLLTNGSMLRDELAEIAVRNLSYIRISLDAPDADTFVRAKRPKSSRSGFDAVVSNVRGLVKLRKELNAGVTISMKYLISRNNINGLEKAADLAQDLGVDSLQFKAVRLFDKLSVDGEEERITQRIKTIVTAHPRLAVVGGIQRADVNMKCWLSPVQIMVDALGDVYLCCYYRHRKKGHTIGNLFTDPLQKIWYSERHFDAIRKIKIKECNHLDCRFGAYNRIMHEMMIKDKAQLDFI